ncbi:MAG TPA: hypothetical protein VIM64_00275 [Puia sp.]
MSELFGQMNETPSMDGELLRAMAGKIMNLAEAVKGNTDQTGKLLEQAEEIRGLKEQMASQEKRVEELIEKEGQVMEAVQRAAGKIDLPVEKVERLQRALDNQIRWFQEPLDKTVRHHHLVGKAFWVLFGLILISSAVSAMMVWQWRRADQHATNDMRWRAVKLIADPAVMKVVDQVDSASLADPKKFAREIEAEEDRREDLAKNILKEQEARQRIEELEKQKAKK